MAEHFVKSDKSTDTVLGLVNYASTDEIKSEEIHQIYDKWADQYEQDMKSINYNPPLILANEVERFYGNKRNLRILDLAAGTGLGGKHLCDRGFNDLDALDASANMLEKAKQTGHYKQLYKEVLGQRQTNIPNDSYDAVVTAGSFVPGHLTEECYEELLRITKKGGHIFILMKERYFTVTPEYSSNLEPRMLELQEQGLWKRVLKKDNIPNYHEDNTGVLFILQKC